MIPVIPNLDKSYQWRMRDWYEDPEKVRKLIEVAKFCLRMNYITEETALEMIDFNTAHLNNLLQKEQSNGH